MKNIYLLIIIFLFITNLFSQTKNGRIELYKQENLKQKFFKEAIESGNIDKVKLYLDAGVNPNVVWDFKGHIENYTGISPLVYSIKLRNMELAKLLIQKGAQVNSAYYVEKKVFRSNWEYDYKEILTNTLAEVVKLRNIDGIKLLLESGAKKEFALNEAKATNDENIINLFIQSGSTITYNSSDLENAVKGNKDIEFIKNILSQNVRPNDWTLIFAVERGDITLIDLLIDNGANVNNSVNANTGSWSPICAAVNYGNLNVIKHLIENKGANYNTKCQVKSYVQNTYYSLVEFSQSSNCYRKSKDVTEYLLLIPDIMQNKK